MSQDLYISHLKQQIKALGPIQKRCQELNSYTEKLAYISSLEDVKQFFQDNDALARLLDDLPPDYQYVVKAVVALGQGPVIFADWQNVTNKQATLEKMIEVLFATERFYDYMGGIPGYHVKTLELICTQLQKTSEEDTATLLPPPVVDVRLQNAHVDKLIVQGLESMKDMAEIYVVGGAGDRLQLIDEKTQNPLPVARLNFVGNTLLEGLVRDLEAREYCQYKVLGTQLCTPIVLMTSHDKKNDQEIAAILEEKNYFGRPKESIFRLLQPLAPVLTVEGTWAIVGSGELVLKPGGHGVIWKLAEQYGAFDWLEKKSRVFCVIRQINNPLAGLDYNLLVLAGHGYGSKKTFGFESVPRLPNMSEGMNVLRQVQNGSKVDLSISNIEYTEFARREEHDPEFARIANSPNFPANTNILFANLKEVRKAAKKLPVPGFLVNMKHPVDTICHGQKVALPGARLESTMQNIADVMTSSYKVPLNEQKLQALETFVLLNERAKTMSVTKKAYDGKSILETPEGCFYDLMLQNIALLQNRCAFDVASLNSREEYLKEGPSTIFLYHPALGPLYSVIGQKLSKGKLAKNSELQIEAAEVAIHNLDLDGSLLIQAYNITGKKNATSGLLEFSNQVGHITLEKVRVLNQGIDRSAKNEYFKNKIQRKELLKIILEGHSELIAQNVTFTGNIEIVVPDQTLARVTQAQDGKVQVSFEPLKSCQSYRYSIDSNNQIVLKK